jgi:two-component system, LytTR family, sensor kinase
VSAESVRGLVRVAVVAAVWTACGALLAAQAYVAGAMRGEPVALSRALAIWLAFAYAWAVVTPAVLWIATRFPFARPRRIRAVVAHLAGGALVVSLQLALFAVVAPFAGATSYAGTWLATFQRLIVSAFILDLPVYWMIVGAAEIVRLVRTSNERERRTLRMETQLAEARLLVLQAQLQPHFLFNTLNTISVLMREDVDAADRVLVRLGGLLRRALDGSSKPETPLRDELAFLESYLEIEQTRFVDRLSYRLDVEQDVLDARVPSLIFQPLVENAIHHGIARRSAPGRVEITAQQRNGRMFLTVRDDGPGVSSESTYGVGLTNTRARLEQLYGTAQSFELASSEHGGTTVSLTLPFRTGAGR